MKFQYPEKMSERTQRLYDELIDKAQGDRSSEWFTNDMVSGFFDTSPSDYGLSGKLETKTVLIRRAVAIDLMLKAMTNNENSKTTKTAEISEGDLLLGVLPMGSNGLGKVFPQFMTKDELRAGSITNRNTQSLFGHNTINYEKLLKFGLKDIISQCDEKINDFDVVEKKLDSENGILSTADITNQMSNKSRRIYNNKTKKDFYVGVKIACKAVIAYANRFADIAESKSQDPTLTEQRRNELSKMAEIARNVPENEAKNLHEAMQSITFFHIALHASMNLISLGRLDQVLAEYVEKETDKAKALELMECFIIKLAGRLNLSSDYLYEQDHVDYATVLGTHAYYIDQKAGVNNFLQNIIIGGRTPENENAENEATSLILQAFSNVNLSTPGLYVRLGKDSEDWLKKAVAKVLNKTKNNPAILNDDVMIPAMHAALMQDCKKGDPDYEVKYKETLAIANDYCVDGCWEPILNGKSDWTFTMLNLMTPLETSLNQGASLSPDAELFRGAKVAPYVPLPESYEQLINVFKEQVGFFTDQCALSMYLYYMIDEYAAPSPLLSAYLEGCMEKGRDKAWAGAEYNLAGIVFGGVPTVINTILAIKKWVFDEGVYSLKDVAEAFKFNFKSSDEKLQALYTSMQTDFNTNTLKFGDNDDAVKKLTRSILDICYDAVMDSAAFAKKVYQDTPEPGLWKNVIALRRLTGYFGPAINRKLKDFKMKFTAGIGTFEQYNWQGRGIAASADRESGDPIAQNFSPAPGTAHNGAAGVLESFKDLGLNRFAAGVITDLCLDDSKGIDEEYIENLLKSGIDNNAAMLTFSIGSEKLYTEIYEAVLKANSMTDKSESRKLLAPYAGINVRIGGWQTPFITLPLIHMQNYLHRPF